MHALQGRWCVGYLRYEAAEAFDPAMRVHAAEGPLAWFAIHDDALPWPDAEEDDPPDDVTLAWDATLSRRDFDEALGPIHEAIANGEAYQVNLTQMLRASLRVPTGMSPGAASRHGSTPAKSKCCRCRPNCSLTGEIAGCSPAP